MFLHVFTAFHCVFVVYDQHPGKRLRSRWLRGADSGSRGLKVLGFHNRYGILGLKHELLGLRMGPNV